MLAASFARLLAWCRHGAVIATHRNADVDSIATAITLDHVLGSYGEESFEICTPEGVDAISRKVLSALGFGVPSLRKCVGKRIVFVDVSSLNQVEGVEFSECSFIDHHAVNTLTDKCELYIYDPKSVATSALLTEALTYAGYAIPKSYATLLLAGILFDTKFLKIVNQRLLRAVEWLLNSGADFEYVASLLTQREVSYAERVARLRSFSRIGIYLVGENYLATITCVGAYESSSLKFFIEAGADMAIALAPRKDSIRLTVRASERLVKELRTPVAAELARFTGERLGGGGGGHEAAAGAIVPRVSMEILEKVVADFFLVRGYKVRVLDRGRWIEECA